MPISSQEEYKALGGKGDFTDVQQISNNYDAKSYVKVKNADLSETVYRINPDGSLTRLPARHVDTGMGFERVTSIIQGTNHFSDFANFVLMFGCDFHFLNYFNMILS